MTPQRRKAAACAVVGAAPLLVTALAAGPAQAHGAPQDPVSRTAACGSEGGRNAQSAACRAAIAAGGGQAIEDWDNLRVADVRGKDREKIPDGKLCSGGIEEFKGLDLPRPDWPATRLTAGAELTLSYRATIPHQGTFEFYLTKDGYDPTRALSWSDLERKPFLTATDPALNDGSYVIRGRLPSSKTGRHLLYTVWRNSDTPDTYYSCSDVVFGGAGAGPSASGADRGSGNAVSEAPGDRRAAGSASSQTLPAGSGDSDINPAPLVAGGAVALVATAGVIAATTIRRRRS